MIKYNNFKSNCSVDSILTIRASGSIDNEVINDLIQEEGKSIAELINDQKKHNNKNKNQNQNPQTS